MSYRIALVTLTGETLYHSKKGLTTDPAQASTYETYTGVNRVFKRLYGRSMMPRGCENDPRFSDRRFTEARYESVQKVDLYELLTPVFGS
jgi:hypothetical protein